MVLLLGGLVAGLISAFPAAAAADCSGPTISVSPESGAARGEQVTVTGSYFGANCYDTGPPPAGQGIFGTPLDDIEIVFVQGTTELVVARGAADNDYAFSVDVTVPADLQPGEVLLQVRSNGLFSSALQSFVLTDAPPVGSAPASSEDVATFGPASPAAPAGPDVTQPRTAEPDRSSNDDDNSPPSRSSPPHSSRHRRSRRLHPLAAPIPTFSRDQ
jgi:hypothetical protein